TGTSQTNAGMVCIRSITGRTIWETREDFAAAIPIGTARANATSVAMSTIASVSIASCHCSTLMTNNHIASDSSASLQTRSSQAIAENSTANARASGAPRIVARPVVAHEMKVWIVSKTTLRFVWTQLN